MRAPKKANSYQFTGTKARVIGGICIGLAIVFFLDGRLWVVHTAGFIRQAV
jgi:type III secretory pathway component EscT